MEFDSKSASVAAAAFAAVVALPLLASARPAPTPQAETLAAVPTHQAAYVALRLQPSLSYFASSWPIDAIWEANKEEEVPPIDLTSGGTSLEIRRSGEAVSWRRLDPGSFAFRTALADGLVLVAAMTAATLTDPAFDLTAALRQVLGQGLAVGFVISPQHKETPR